MIKSDDLYLCVDMTGGMCDRVMKGKRGIIFNAQATLDTWKSFANDEDIEKMDDFDLSLPEDEITDKMVDYALTLLCTDNFKVIEMNKDRVYLLTDNMLVVGSDDVIGFNDNKDIEVLNVSNIEWTEKAVYNIY